MDSNNEFVKQFRLNFRAAESVTQPLTCHVVLFLKRDRVNNPESRVSFSLAVANRDILFPFFFVFFENEVAWLSGKILISLCNEQTVNDHLRFGSMIS